MATSSARPRRRRGCGRCLRWPRVPGCRCGRTRSAEGALCCEQPPRAPHLPALPGEGQPQQDLVLPLPALNPLHQSCHPRSQGVPVAFWSREGPVPSVPAALRGPGVPVPLVCTELPGLPFPWALLWCSLSFPALGRCHRNKRCRSQLTCGVCQALGVLSLLSLAVQAAHTSVTNLPGQL